MARYLRCLATGLPSNTGVPDGNAQPAVVWNRRFVNTLMPDSNGELKFILMISPNAVVFQLAGQGIYGNRYTLDAGSANGLLPATTTSPVQRINNEVCTFLTNPNFTVPSNDSCYRLVNAVHELRFTGSALTNGGQVVVVPINNDVSETSIGTSGTHREAFVDNISIAPRLTPQSLSGAARDSITLVHLPRDTSYASSSDLIVNTNLSTPGLETPAGCGDLRHHPATRLYYVTYTGLHSSSSITIDSRVCVQETVPHNSSLATLGKASEMTDNNVLNNFLGTMGSSPLMRWGANKAKELVMHAIRQSYPQLAALTNI